MHLFVGSANPVKIEAARRAACVQWPDLIVTSYDVQSGVSAQPRSDAETRQGAQNRALRALERGCAEFPTETQVLGVSTEGGVTEIDGELWNTVWAAVADRDGRLVVSNGSRFLVPASIAQPILAGGEMGPVVDQLSGVQEIRQKQGMIGLITNELLTRTEEYSGVLKLAIGVWWGQVEPWQRPPL